MVIATKKISMNSKVSQTKSPEWHEQWSLFQDHEPWLFEDWIAPIKLEDFQGKAVLECGCGGGQHTSWVAPLATSITAIDLNTTDIARERNQDFQNITFIEDDIANMNLNRQFDIVFCIGVIHHTDNPDKTFTNMYHHCKPGGLMIVWTYSAEGNVLVRWGVEPIRKLLLSRLSRKTLDYLATIITAGLYPFVYTTYLIPWLKFLPYYEYFTNFRKLSFRRNVANVFDKLNAPQTYFTRYETCQKWFNTNDFEPDTISIRSYRGVSYSLCGRKKD